MTRFPGLALALVVIALLLASGGQATPGQSTTLHGRVGPGFTISLTTESGARVTKLDPGTYDIEVQDLSDEHNFHLSGPGVDKATEIGSQRHRDVDGDRARRDVHVPVRSAPGDDERVLHRRERPDAAACAAAGGRRGHAEDEARPHLGAGLHDHAQDEPPGRPSSR